MRIRTGANNHPSITGRERLPYDLTSIPSLRSTGRRQREKQRSAVIQELWANRITFLSLYAQQSLGFASVFGDAHDAFVHDSEYDLATIPGRTGRWVVQ